MDKSIKNKNINKKPLYLFLITLTTIFMSIGYATINSITLDISGDVSLVSQEGLFITEVNYDSNIDANLEESKIITFSSTTLNSRVVLSNTNGNSSITYKIKVYNKNNETYRFNNSIYDNAFYSNQNIIFTLTGIDKDTKIEPHTFKEFSITFSYKDNIVPDSNTLVSYIGFNFKINQTQMETTLVNNYVPSGNVEDIEHIDIESMEETERKQKFSNIATGKEIHTIKGINNENVILLRGNYDDNYVSFGGFTWRILQIDENGNLRIVLDGVISGTTSKYRNSASADTLDLAKEMLAYGNSNIKPILDNWYQNNLASNSDKIVKSKFCVNFDYYTRKSSGTYANVNYFQSYENLGQDSNNYSPILVCTSKYITQENIGLISAEEVVLAGGAYKKNNTSYFLYNSSIDNYYWTLSPAYYDPTHKNGNVFIVDKNGAPTDWTRNLLTNSYYIRPVITINGNFEMTGDGTINNPYQYK